MRTHRIWDISRFSAHEAVVRFHEGHFEDEADLEGNVTREFKRGPVLVERTYRFDGDCTEAGLRELLNSELLEVSDLSSVTSQVREKTPSLRVMRVREKL